MLQPDQRCLLQCFLNEPRATIPWFSKEMRLRTLKMIAKFCREYMCFSLENLAQEVRGCAVLYKQLCAADSLILQGSGCWNAQYCAASLLGIFVDAKLPRLRLFLRLIFIDTFMLNQALLYSCFYT